MLNGCGVERIRKVPRLLALDHINKFRRKHIPTIGGTSFAQRFFTPFAPDIAMSNVMIIRDADRRAILHDIGKLHAKLQPTIGCFLVGVILVTSKKEQIRILFLQVLYKLSPSKSLSVLWGVTGHVGYHEGFLIDRIFAHQTIKA